MLGIWQESPRDTHLLEDVNPRILMPRVHYVDPDVVDEDIQGHSVVAENKKPKAGLGEVVKVVTMQLKKLDALWNRPKVKNELDLKSQWGNQSNDEDFDGMLMKDAAYSFESGDVDLECED